MNRLLNNALKITASAAETILCLSLSFPATQKQTHIGNTTTTPIPPSPAPSPLCCAASIIQILSCLFQTAGSSLPPPPSPSLSLSLCLSFSLSRKRKVWGEKELFEGQSWQNHTQTKYTKLHWTANVKKKRAVHLDSCRNTEYCLLTPPPSFPLISSIFLSPSPLISVSEESLFLDHFNYPLKKILHQFSVTLPIISGDLWGTDCHLIIHQVTGNLSIEVGLGLGIV